MKSVIDGNNMEANTPQYIQRLKRDGWKQIGHIFTRRMRGGLVEMIDTQTFTYFRPPTKHNAGFVKTWETEYGFERMLFARAGQRMTNPVRPKSYIRLMYKGKQ